MTLTAMRPDSGLSKGREVSLRSVSHASASDLRLERRLQRLVGIVRAQEIGVAYEEALPVVVGIHEPAGDAVRPVAAHLARVRVKHVDSVDPYHDLAVVRVEEIDVRLAENDEQVALARVFQVRGHVQVGVHARLQHRQPAQPFKLRGVGLVVERAGDQQVELPVRRFAGGLDQVWPRDRAELRADEDRRAAQGALLLAALEIAPLRADEMARPGIERGEGDAVLLVRLLHAGRLEVLQDDLGEVVDAAVAAARLAEGVDELVVLVDGEDAVGGDAFDGEGAGDAHLLPVFVGLVVEVLVVGPGSDRGIDLLLAGDALLPPDFMQHLYVRRPALIGLARDLPLLPVRAEGGVQLLPQRFQYLLVLLPDHVDLGVVGDGAQRDMRHALIDEALADVAVAGAFPKAPCARSRPLSAALRGCRPAGSRDSVRP